MVSESVRTFSTSVTIDNLLVTVYKGVVFACAIGNGGCTGSFGGNAMPCLIVFIFSVLRFNSSVIQSSNLLRINKERGQSTLGIKRLVVLPRRIGMFQITRLVAYGEKNKRLGHGSRQQSTHSKRTSSPSISIAFGFCRWITSSAHNSHREAKGAAGFEPNRLNPLFLHSQTRLGPIQ